MIYLASPYSHSDPAVREERYKAVCQVAGKLISRGLHVYSPIAHCHAISLLHDLPGDFQFWREYNFAHLRRADALLALTIEGHAESKGMLAEVELASTLSLPFGEVNVAGEIKWR